MLRALQVLLVAGLLHGFLEWLFFATRSTFAAELGWTQSVLAMLIVSNWAVAALTLAQLVAAAVALGLAKVHATRAAILTLYLLPGVAVASIVLILVDNFTYTVAGFGIVSTRLTRVFYAVGFLGLVGWLVARRYRRDLREPLPAGPRAVVLAGLADRRFKLRFPFLQVR